MRRWLSRLLNLLSGDATDEARRVHEMLRTGKREDGTPIPPHILEHGRAMVMAFWFGPAEEEKRKC